MDIRILQTEKDLIQSHELSSIAFNYPMDAEHAREYVTEPDLYDIWGAMEDGKLVSQVRAVNFDMRYHGNDVKMFGIGDVSSLVESRNRGHIRALFHAIFMERKARGDVFSYLYPFSFKYYEQFGYAQAISKAHVHFPPSMLSKHRCTCEVVRHEKGQDPAPYARVFDAFAAQYTGMVRRSDWKRLDEYQPTKNRRVMYLLRREGVPCAFLGYLPEGEGATSTMKVLDSAWVDEDAMKQLLGFIGSLRSHYFDCEMWLPQDLPLAQMLDDPYRLRHEVRIAGQARVIDVEAALSGYPWPAHKGSIAIRVEDDFFEDNCATFLIEYDKDGSRVSRTNQQPDLRLDIRALSPLLLGTIGYADLLYLDQGWAEILGNQPALKAAFARRSCYIAEAF
ncbi:GNAT family N-acetyltransferase [Eubacteriales bacterium OttesenSCG-928-N13]|nr:GNAT family N-acetyltransferase [Eubacteriales bacterium OttesenSCG-928-N13]